jgi:hypothetical protein
MQQATHQHEKVERARIGAIRAAHRDPFFRIKNLFNEIKKKTDLVKVESVDLVRVPAEGRRRLGGVHGCVPPPSAPTGGTLTAATRTACWRRARSRRLRPPFLIKIQSALSTLAFHSKPALDAHPNALPAKSNRIFI